MDTRFLLGKAIQVHLKEGGAFYLKVTEIETDGFSGEVVQKYITGMDDEGREITININDIAFIK